MEPTEQINLATLPKYLSNEAAAWELLERLRWPEGQVTCPHCGVIDPKHYFIAARSGERTTRAGNVTYRRVWRCRHCKKQFSVLVGTIFESSKIAVSKWLLGLWLFNAGKNGVSALELQRHLGIAYQSAWFMAHRLREAATRKPLSDLLSGTIIADETWVGGDPKNWHRSPRPAGRQGYTDKTPVAALIHKETGEARTQVVTRVTSHTLRALLTKNVDTPSSTLHTDGHGSYKGVGREFKDHESVDHHSGEYVRGNVTTNHAESFFAQFKRSLDGTHHSVGPQHLHRYANEFAFRWTTCKMTDAQRVQAMVDASVGKRLTYRPLTDP